MTKHRYLIILALPVAALFPGISALNPCVARTLRDLKIEDAPGAAASLTSDLKIPLTLPRALDRNELAVLKAAIEADFSRQGASVLIEYQGSDGSPEEAPITREIRANEEAKAKPPLTPFPMPVPSTLPVHVTENALPKPVTTEPEQIAQTEEKPPTETPASQTPNA